MKYKIERSKFGGVFMENRTKEIFGSVGGVNYSKRKKFEGVMFPLKIKSVVTFF